MSFFFFFNANSSRVECVRVCVRVSFRTLLNGEETNIKNVATPVGVVCGTGKQIA
jgi:hypothetical protein